MSGTKILLDTNVWSYLADRSLGDVLQAASVKSGASIIVAPSVVQEALAIPEVPFRNKVVELQTRRRWTRLMPEAFLQCEEIISEVRRTRPNWLLPTPDVRRFRRHKYDWTRTNQPRGSNSNKLGFWERVRRQPDVMAQLFRSPYLDQARTNAKAARDRLRAVGDDKLPSLVDAILVPVDAETGTVHSKGVEPWRLTGMWATNHHLASEGDPYHDWLEPFVLPVWITQPTYWEQFWIKDVVDASMPRHWLRWAFEHLQQTRTVSRGTPGDAQLSAYLLDADYIVSADKVFVDLVNQIRVQGPYSIATALRISGDAAGTDRLLDLIRSL